MVITILYTLFYLLGVVVSYMSVVLYEYYSDKTQYSCPQVKLNHVKQKFNEDFFAPTIVLSWIFFILFLLIVLIKKLKCILDKLIAFIVLR